MGIPSLDTGVFGGLILGCVAAYMFNRFFRIKLPQYLGFFAGKRFVPIITSLAAIVVGILFSFIWPPIGGAIDSFADAAAEGGTSRLQLPSMVLWNDCYSLRPASRVERAVLLPNWFVCGSDYRRSGNGGH